MRLLSTPLLIMNLIKSATSISKSSILLDRQIKTSASKNVEADDEDGNKNEST